MTVEWVARETVQSRSCLLLTEIAEIGGRTLRMTYAKRDVERIAWCNEYQEEVRRVWTLRRRYVVSEPATIFDSSLGGCQQYRK